MKWLLAVPVALYTFYAVAIIWLHPTFIYPFGADRFDTPGYDRIVFEDEGFRFALSETTGDVAVLYFMGNGGSLSYFTSSIETHRIAQRRVLALHYRGGGGVSGTPSETALKADALAMYDWLARTWDGPIVVHGFSLGTGLAVHVAARRDVNAIILDAPYVRLCELMAQAAYLPACYLPFVQKWDTARDIEALSAPILIQHGTRDRLIPPNNGARLAQLMTDAELDVTFTLVDGATHNNLAGQAGYVGWIKSFVDSATN